MPPTKNRPVYLQVADELRHRILTGDLLPGERLPIESELAAQFSVSRSSVREALRLLTAQNLTVTRRGVTGGTFVNRPDPSQVSESLMTGLDFLTLTDELSVAELLEARELLEVPAARLASTRRTEKQLESIISRLPASPGVEHSPTFEPRRDFHVRIVEAANNPLLEVMTVPIFYVLRTRFLRDRAPKRFWRRVDEDHRRIAEAIVARDADLVAKEMLEHLQRLRKTYEKIDRQPGSSR